MISKKFQIRTMLITLSVIFLSISTHGNSFPFAKFSNTFAFAVEFLDSLTNEYMIDLQKDSVSYLIKYSKKSQSFENIPIQNYLLWKQNNSIFLKKYSYEFVKDSSGKYNIYENIKLDSDKNDSLIIRLVMESFQNEFISKNLIKIPVYHFLDFGSYIEEVFIKYKSDYCCFSKINNGYPSLHDMNDQTLNNLNDILKIYSKDFQSPKIGRPDTLAIEHISKEIKDSYQKVQRHRDTTLQNLLISSVPISDVEFSSLSKLEQEAYKLYEYLMNNNVLEISIPSNKGIKYFLVPYITIGHYTSTTNNAYSYQESQTKVLKNFRPRCYNKSIEKYLYMNEDIEKYYDEYDKYGCLPGICHTESTLMSGYMQFIASPPAIMSIMFNDTYANAKIGYRDKSRYYSIIMQKSSSGWFIDKIIDILEID